MRFGLGAAGVFGLALLVRLLYLADIATVPFVEHPLIDARAYDDWARRIASGDWLGSEAFYQAPAYPYFLGLVYWLAGPDLAAAHVVQMVMGAVSCVVMALATRTLFGDATGIAAGLLLALYPPAIFFDGVIGKSTLALLLTTLLLALLLRGQLRPRVTVFAAAGAVMGLLALTRENALVFAAAIPLWMAVRFREAGTPAVVRRIAAFAAGAVLVLGPVAVRNAVLGDTFALTTSQLGTNFYIGNNPDATGFYSPLLPGRSTPEFESPDATRLAEQALGRTLTRGEVSSYWLERGLEFVRDEPGRFLGLLVWKAIVTWNDVEVSDTEDLYVYAEWSPLLRALALPLRFGVLAPLAVLGAFLAWRERRDVWLLCWLALVFTGAVALFLVFARFRYPLVSLLLPLAAVGIVRGVARLRQRRWRELVRALPAVLLVAAVVNWPVISREKLKVSPYLNIAYILRTNGDEARAESYLERALAASPDEVETLVHLGSLRLDQGRLPQAESHLRRAIELDPDDYRAHALLAKALARQGRHGEARRHRALGRSLGPQRGSPPAARSAPPAGAPREAPAAGVDGAAGGPDIYYALLGGAGDGGRARGELVGWLRSRDFHVAADSRVNYSRRDLSLASTLNYTYLDALARRVGRDSRDLAPLSEWIRASRLRHALERRGYAVHSFETQGGSALESLVRVAAEPGPKLVVTVVAHAPLADPDFSKALREAIDGVLAASPASPVFVLQTDPGDVAEPALGRLAILNAYRLPGDAATSLHPGISPVNSFRLILGRYLDEPLARLPDRHFHSPPGRPFDFVELVPQPGR